MNDDELTALRAEVEALKQKVALLRESQTTPNTEEFPGPDKDDAITALRDLLAEARFIAFDLHRGGSNIYGTSSVPWPDWISSDESPFDTFVHIDGADTAPAGSRLNARCASAIPRGSGHMVGGIAIGGSTPMSRHCGCPPPRCRPIPRSCARGSAATPNDASWSTER